MTTRFFCALLLSLTLATNVQAQAEDVIEMSYEDLVEELASRKSSMARPTSNVFNEIRVHSGFGMVQSFSQFEVRGETRHRYQNGLQLAMGVDLFSPRWFAETAWRNFGLTHMGTEEHLLREWLLKFGYRDDVQPNAAYRLQMGLSNRFLKLTDPMEGLDISENTPHFFGSGGVVFTLNPMISLNMDVSGRAPVISGTVDKGSWDFTIDLKVSL